jgi:transcriptional regulator with XRE-family HTH domain
MLTAHDKFLLDKLGHLTSSGAITQNEICRATGVHQSQISRMLAGHSRRRSPNLKKLCAYAESMHWNLDISAVIPPALAQELAHFVGAKSGDEKGLGDVLIALRNWRSDWRRSS